MIDELDFPPLRELSPPPRPRPIIAAAGLPPVPDSEREDRLRLDMNENLWGPSPRAVEALAHLEHNHGAPLAAYGFSRKLTVALATSLGVTPEEVLVTAGSDEAISVLFETYVDPGERVLLATPTFVTFQVEAETTGAIVREVPFGDDFAFPRVRYLEALSDPPRLAVLVNPNNPTGTAVALDVVKEACLAAPETLVISDEAYFDYHGETALSIVPRPPNLVVIRTFSKAYGLAGLRVGFLVGHPELVDSVRKVLPPFSVSVAGLAAAMGALEDRWYLASHVTALRREMKNLVASLEERGFPTLSSRANFVLVRVGPRAPDVARALAARGILVADRSQEPPLTGMLRITVGRPEQNRKLLEALEVEAARLF